MVLTTLVFQLHSAKALKSSNIIGTDDESVALGRRLIFSMLTNPDSIGLAYLQRCLHFN